jgi:hypothetical protein
MVLSSTFSKVNEPFFKNFDLVLFFFFFNTGA